MEMIFAPGFPVGQRRELEAYCRTNKVRCSQQLAAGSELLIGSIILGIGFGAKSFLEEFLKELAKDVYRWLKTGSAVEQCAKERPINATYHTRVGNVFIHDSDAAFTGVRHRNVLEAIPRVFDGLQFSEQMKVERIELILQEASSDYAKARCFESKSESFGYDEEAGRSVSIDKPFAFVDLLNRSDSGKR